MKYILEIFETYLMVLVHPFRIHQQFRFSFSLPYYPGKKFKPLTLAESIGISWIFAIIQGLLKIVLLNIFLQAFLSFQSENFPIIQDLLLSSGMTTYYFFLFSGCLDVIFYPLGVIIGVEVWNWVIKKYARFLNPGLEADKIAEQITTHALASNLFLIIPFFGSIIQSFLHLFLLYAGLRSHLGASRSLSLVILVTPIIVLMMALSVFFLVVFYLIS
jgi:hypothetical protein